MKFRALRFHLGIWILLVVPMRSEAQWWPVLSNDSVNITALGANAGYVYAGLGWNRYYPPQLYRSCDYGLHWQSIDTTLPTNRGSMSRIAFFDSLVYVGFSSNAGSGLYRSSDQGDHWLPVSFPYVGGAAIADIVTGPNASGDTNIYVGTYGFYFSTDRGSTWQTGGLRNKSVSSLAVLGWSLYAFTETTFGFGGEVDSILLSNDFGLTWVPVMSGLTDSPGGEYIAAAGGVLIVGIGSHVYLSTNYGSSWQRVSDPLVDCYAWCILSDTSHFFVANQYGIFLSTDYGASWIDTHLYGAPMVWSMAVEYNALFASVYGRGVIARDLTPLLGVSGQDHGPPQIFELAQNFPNPWNPSTTISFSLPKSSHVTLSIYNLLGQLVQKVVDESRPIGNYDVVVDGSKWASGVYFYRFDAVSVGDPGKRLMSVKKMLLIR